MIYLFSSDGYWDSVNREHYATSIDEIKQMAIAHELQFDNDVNPSSFTFEEEKGRISYTYKDYSGFECQGRCHFIILNPFKT